jgi:hypothetical protein
MPSTNRQICGLRRAGSTKRSNAGVMGKHLSARARLSSPANLRGPDRPRGRPFSANGCGCSWDGKADRRIASPCTAFPPRSFSGRRGTSATDVARRRQRNEYSCRRISTRSPSPLGAAGSTDSAGGHRRASGRGSHDGPRPAQNSPRFTGKARIKVNDRPRDCRARLRHPRRVRCRTAPEARRTIRSGARPRTTLRHGHSVSGLSRERDVP